MEKRFKFQPNMIGSYADHNAIQDFTAETFDDLVGDAVTKEKRFAGFNATQTSTTELKLAIGRVYNDGEIYKRSEEHVVNLLGNLPGTTEKIVAVVGSTDTTDTNTQAKQFIVNTETRESQASSVKTETHRLVEIAVIQGLESAAPQKPATNTNTIIICWVWLDNAGITKIEMNEDDMLPSTGDNADRLDDLELWKKAIGQQIATVGSDISALSQRQGLAGESDVVYQIASDMARVKELLELEDNFAYYGADRYLDDGESDTGNVNYDCKLEEGIRFSDDAADLQALDVFNQHDPNIIISDGFLLPKFTEVERIGITNQVDESPVSQYPFETVDYVQKTMSRTRIRYGATRTYCTNSAWWRSGRYDSAQRVFTRGGETWQVLSGNPFAHSWLRVRRFWYDTYDETYWDRIVNNYSVNGAMICQTIPCTQDTWMTSLDLFFTQVAASENVTVLLTETKYGKPDLDAVIQSVTLNQADMVANDWTNVPFPATFLSKGKSYGICLITQGNHYIGMASGVDFSVGTFFYSTDGEFFQGDLTKDMCLRINAAQFTSPRIEVPLEALSLSGGIADIDLMAEMVIPDATELRFEIKPQGGEWQALDEVQAGGPTAFLGLPPLCEFRATFIGTKDVMPGINLTTSTYKISRPRTTGKHISKVITLPAATQSFKVNLKIEEFFETNHDCTVTIDDVTNGNDDIAAATTSDQLIEVGDDANHLNIKRTFAWGATELPVATTQIRINITIATSSALDVFHGSELVYLSF